MLIAGGKAAIAGDSWWRVAGVGWMHWVGWLAGWLAGWLRCLGPLAGAVVVWGLALVSFFGNMTVRGIRPISVGSLFHLIPRASLGMTNLQAGHSVIVYVCVCVWS